MSKIKIGIIKEGKNPPDSRTAVVPEDAEWLKNNLKSIDLRVQSSEIRVFPDDAYAKKQIEVVPSIDDCNVIVGVKEIPEAWIQPHKTYFFFSHTIKKQPYNQSLLRTIINKKCTLIDYECIKDIEGNRLIAFGRFAGIVGAYNGLLAFGIRSNNWELKRVHELEDLNELISVLRKTFFEPIRIVITGDGRVGNGARYVLDEAGFTQLSPDEFLAGFGKGKPVYTQLGPADYNKPVNSVDTFRLEDFFQNPGSFKGDFGRFLPHADLLIAGAYWDPKAPVLFTREDLIGSRLKVIADITCDIGGSIPSTLRATEIDDPFYDYDPKTGKERPVFSSDDYVTVMSIDNLPSELPKDSSRHFSRIMAKEIIPLFLKNDEDPIIDGATIVKKGKLNKLYHYLSDYAGLG